MSDTLQGALINSDQFQNRLFSSMCGSEWPLLNRRYWRALSPGDPLLRMVLNSLVTYSELPEVC